jgi:hypothetical protein
MNGGELEKDLKVSVVISISLEGLTKNITRIDCARVEIRTEYLPNRSLDQPVRDVVCTLYVM